MATSNFIREMVGAWLHRGANIGEGYFSLFITNSGIPARRAVQGVSGAESVDIAPIFKPIDCWSFQNFFQ
ncbi:MAG TPA: hypothetical protein VHR47_03170 [Bacillota bacterium]|nr:hypothetical protein [Bacillota bacterium]